MITRDHKGGGGVWIGPKYDHTILEQPLNVDTNRNSITNFGINVKIF
jgi:hypothetical protein